MTPEVIDDAGLIPDEPIETKLEVNTTKSERINTTTTITGQLTTKEEDTPIPEVIIYTTIRDQTYAAQTGEDGTYTQELPTPDTPGLETITTRFLGDYEYQASTTANVLPITYTTPLDEEEEEGISPLKTLEEGVDPADLTYWEDEGELLNGSITFELPEGLQGIWEVTAEYPQQDIYKYSKLVEEVQFNRTPYFQTEDNQDYFTAQVNFSCCVKAQLCDSDGTPLGNKKVATKWESSDSDTTYTDDDGWVSKCVTRYTIGETGTLLFHYGGNNSKLNPCDLEVTLEWTAYETRMSVNNPTYMYIGEEGTVKPRFYYYETEYSSQSNVDNRTPLANREITMYLNGGLKSSNTYTATTDSNGYASFTFAPPYVGTYTYTLEYAGSSTYTAYSTETYYQTYGYYPSIEVLTTSGEKIDTTLSLTSLTAERVARTYPITIQANLVNANNSNPIVNAKIDAKFREIDSNGKYSGYTSATPTPITDDDGNVEVTLNYDKEGQVEFSFTYHGDNIYNGTQTLTKIGTWTKLPAEFAGGDVCCIVGEPIDIVCRLEYVDGWGSMHKIKGEQVKVTYLGKTETYTTDKDTGLFTIEGYTATTKGNSAIKFVYDGSDLYDSCEDSINVYAYESKDDLDPQNTKIEMMEQDTGSYGTKDTTNYDNYYFRVNETARINIKLTSNGSAVAGRKVTPTITHDDFFPGGVEQDWILTDSRGCAYMSLPGQIKYRDETKTYTMKVHFDFEGDYCYNESSQDMILEWEPILPLLNAPSVEHAANQIVTFSADLGFIDETGKNEDVIDENTNFVPLVDAKVYFKLNNSEGQEYGAVTDEKGHAEVLYKRTTEGVWDKSTAYYNGNNYCESVTTYFSIVTLKEARLETYWQLDGDADVIQTCKQPVTWNATLMDQANNVPVGKHLVTTKFDNFLEDVTQANYKKMNSYLNEVYNDGEGQISMTYAHTSRIVLHGDSNPELDSEYFMKFNYGETDPDYQASFVTGSVNWSKITPVLIAPDINMVTDTRVDLDAYLYYENYAGVLVPLNKAQVVLHLGSDTSYTELLTTDSTGKITVSGYHRTSTSAATTYWTWTPSDDSAGAVFEDVKTSFTLNTYATTPSELSTSMTVGKSQYNVERSQSVAVSVTLTASSGAVLANKRVKTSITDDPVSSSTDTPGSYGSEQYITTDEYGVATRYFLADGVDTMTSKKYYFMKFEFDDLNTDLDYKSSSAVATVYTTTVTPVISVGNIHRVVGESVTLKAKMYYTTAAGTFTPVSGRTIEFIDANTGTTIGSAVTSEGDYDDEGNFLESEVGLARLTYKPSSDVTGNYKVTVKYDADYNETLGNDRVYANASTTITILTVENGDE